MVMDVKRRGPAGYPQGVSRLLLLAAIVLGVISMHTIGHHQERPDHVAMAHGVSEDAPAELPDPVSVCLAVIALAGLAGLALPAARLWLGQIVSAGLGSPKWPGREPMPAGLVLTRVAVLRI
jgi:hypothetical protein